MDYIEIKDMDMNSIIAYIGSFKPPIEDAVAKRAMGLAFALNLAGYEVKLLGECNAVARGQLSSAKEYRGIEYRCIHHARNAFEHYDYLVDLMLIKQQIDEWNANRRLKCVIYCGMKCSLLAKGVVEHCRRQGISVIADSMDWLSSHTGNPFFDIVKNLDMRYELNGINRKADGVIAISRYLANYYTEMGKKTMVVPPLSIYEKRSKDIKSKAIPELMYAGVPCRLDRPLKKLEDAKDRLDIAIDILYEIAQRGIPFFFHIYGLTETQYQTAFPHQKKKIQYLLETKCLMFYGRVSEKIVREKTEQVDYTILIREKNRTTMAGFSTKLAESLAIGTPVITTDTSDILQYAVDGSEVIIVDCSNLEKSIQRIAKVLTMEVGERKHIMDITGKNHSFSPYSYCDEVRAFIEQVAGEK